MAGHGDTPPQTRHCTPYTFYASHHQRLPWAAEGLIVLVDILGWIDAVTGALVALPQVVRIPPYAPGTFRIGMVAHVVLNGADLVAHLLFIRTR